MSFEKTCSMPAGASRRPVAGLLNIAFQGLANERKVINAVERALTVFDG